MRFADGSTVLHIGPFKTGTTAIQSALWAARDTLAEHGVHYLGTRAHEMAAATAVAAGKVAPGKDVEHHRRRWFDLVAAMQAAAPRIGFLSSETYCGATDDGARTMLDALGPATEVVITLRPVARILPSQWQQFAQNSVVPDYESWLTEAFGDTDPSARRPASTPSLWRRHRHDLLVERWASYAGADRITVVVVDDREPAGLPAAFEELLGLPQGTLRPPSVRTNRSLTYAEVVLVQELVRRTSAPPWVAEDRRRFVSRGAARGLQALPVPAGAEPVLTPQWAVDQALHLGAAMAEGIVRAGVRVIGDLALLSDPDLAPRTGSNAPVSSVSAAALDGLITGIVEPMTAIDATGKRPPSGAVSRAVWERRRAVADPGEDPASTPPRRSLRR